MNLLGTLVGLDSTSIGVLFNFLQYSSVIGIVDEPVGLLLGSELVSPLGPLLDYDTWPPVHLQLILYRPPGSKVIYPDLVGYSL